MEFTVSEENFYNKYFQKAKSSVSTHTDGLKSAEYRKDTQLRLSNSVSVRLQKKAHQRVHNDYQLHLPMRYLSNRTQVCQRLSIGK